MFFDQLFTDFTKT